MIESATSTTRCDDFMEGHVEHRLFRNRELYLQSCKNSNDCNMKKNATSSSNDHPPIVLLDAANPNYDARVVSIIKHSPYNSELARFEIKLMKTKILFQSSDGSIERDRMSQRFSKNSDGNTVRKSILCNIVTLFGHLRQNVTKNTQKIQGGKSW